MLLVTGFHGCHQIYMNHPFSSNTIWLMAENGWPDGFHASLDVLSLLLCNLKYVVFLLLYGTCAPTSDE
jgi:hypothetical protein